MRALAALLMVLLLVAPLPGSCGTTGTLTGRAVDERTGLPIAGAAVSVASPSQSVKTTTDARGRFAFVSLAPDTYTVTIGADGYAPSSEPGIVVVTDQSTTFTARLVHALRTIGSVQSTGGLVRTGQTSDTYTIGDQQSRNAQALGGGGALYQTYAALATVPGVYVPQAGLNQGQNNSAPFIRGGNFTQVGYEFDGVPVQRAYDGYVGTTQGTTGQQALQVYTGGGPASAAGEALAGYVNQVIKTGTLPGYTSVEGTLGSTTFYHYLTAETGGATRDRAFSYYVGLTGWNQSYRYGDPFNGGLGLSPSAAALVPTGNGSVFAIPYAAGSAADTSDTASRESVANLHWHLGHDGSDDVQFLVDIGRQLVHVYDSVSDLGGLRSPFWNYTTGGTTPTFPVATVYEGPVFSAYDPARVASYAYPATGATATYIPADLRGSQDSNNSLLKLQYQKNFGSTAYARIYGYSNYSSWFVDDPIGAYYLPLPESGILGLLDDEVTTHTRGLALQFADQLGGHNLLQGSASYSYSNDLRWYNSTSYNPGFDVQLRDGRGNCYDTVSGALANCYGSGGNVYAFNPATLLGGSAISGTPGPAVPAVPGGVPTGTGYQAVTSGYSVVLGQPQPKFTTVSLDDQWNSDKLTLDVGARYNRYVYGLGDTSEQGVVGGSNANYFTSFNAEHCYDASSGTLSLVFPGAACPTGSTHTTIAGDSASSLGYSVLEPRASGTWSFSPTQVLRFSAGTYSQPTRAAYIQYEPTTDIASYLARHFLQYGFTTPSHDIPPQVSHNYDLSFEARLAHAPVAFSFSPFYRLTNNQTQAFVLDPTSSFQSGLNVGTLRAFGYEALVRLGDEQHDGLSGNLAFTYTNSKIRYDDFRGTNRNVIDGINSALNVAGYNALTRAGGGSPCYATVAASGSSGAGVARAGSVCPAGTVANPYYDASLQPAAPLDRNGWYSPYNLIPTSNGSDIAFGYNSISYDIPEALTASVQWKHAGWRIVPTAQYDLGFRYSSPFAWTGYDPSSCTSTVSTSCASLFRPDPYTGGYDGLGTFKSPSTLTLGLQVSHPLGRGVTASAVLSNLFTRCFTHGYPWETGGNRVCSYALNPPQNSGGPYLGNATNANVNSVLVNDPYGYAPYTAGFPFNAYFSLAVRL